jgi:hypothetical protein
MPIIKLYPTSKKAREDAETFFRVVGECITTWSFIDRRLFRLFKYAVGLYGNRAAIVYYQWRTIDARLSLIDRLLKGALTEKHFLKKWRPLKNSIDDLLETRAIIAHQPPLRTGIVKAGRAVYFYSLHVEPSERSLKKGHRGLQGKEQLFTADLKRHLRRLDLVPKKLAAFQTFVSSLKGRS